MSIFLTESALCSKDENSARWSALIYVLTSWMGGDDLRVSATPESSALNGGAGLRVDLSWIVRQGDIKSFDRLKLRLHYPDGSVVEPLFASNSTAVSSGVVVAIRKFFFPYGKNMLTEAWLELRVDDHVDWLEVPYGFTRNPEDSLPPSDPKAEGPQYAPAMFQMKKEDDIVRWNEVQYKIGSIQNDWDLEVSIVDRGPIRCLVKLRRPEGRWAIHTPVTTIKVEKNGGGTIMGQQISSRLESPTCREDEFEFEFEPLSGRGWADLIVTVDAISQSRTIALGTFLPGLWKRPVTP